MKEAMATAKLPTPHIRQTEFYTIAFKRPLELNRGKGGEKIGGRAEKRLAGGLVEKGVVDTTQKTTQKILEAIAKKSDITQKELAVVIGITEDGVKYHITRLRKKGVVKRIGPDKGGYWEIVNV